MGDTSGLDHARGAEPSLIRAVIVEELDAIAAANIQS